MSSAASQRAASGSGRDLPVAPHGSLKSLRVVFTGKLSMPRRSAWQAVRRSGGEPAAHVSRRTSMVVVGMEGWPLLPDGSVSNKLKRAEELNRKGAQIAIISEARFRELAGLTAPQPSTSKIYPVEHLCKLLNIPGQTLRRWELLSLVQSRDGLYDYLDIVSLRTIADLVNRGVRPETISRSLAGLRSVLPDIERPLSQLRIVMENRDTLLAELGERRIGGDGQMALVFENIEPPHPPAAPAPPRRTAAECFELAAEHEDHERYERSAAAYRQAIALQPRFPEAFFNLGNVLRAQGRPDAACELYRLALAQDPALAEAHYNLADLLEEQGAHAAAVENLRAALDIDPTYADARYNLALLYEETGQADEAAEEWSRYLKLDPCSEWAAIARQHHARLQRTPP